MSNENEKQQFNVRVNPNLRSAAVDVCDRLHFTREELVEVALATILGSKDILILAKGEKVKEAVKELHLSLSPFNDPQSQLALAA
jgi:hypothetical protein